MEAKNDAQILPQNGIVPSVRLAALEVTLAAALIQCNFTVFIVIMEEDTYQRGAKVCVISLLFRTKWGKLIDEEKKVYSSRNQLTGNQPKYLLK